MIEHIDTILAALRHYGSDEFCDNCPAGELCSSKPGAHICNRAAELIEELMGKRGKWKPFDGYLDMAECSECGESYIVNEEATLEIWLNFCELYKYCPNCGARMDLEESDEI